MDCETCGKALAYALPGYPEVIKLSLDRMTDVFLSDLHMKCPKCSETFRLKPLRETGRIDSDREGVVELNVLDEQTTSE